MQRNKNISKTSRNESVFGSIPILICKYEISPNVCYKREFRTYLRFKPNTSVLLNTDLKNKRRELERELHMDPVEDNATKQLQISDECLIVSGAYSK